jgi:hypothetical protein
MKQCAALLICTEYSKTYGPGDRCNIECEHGSDFCWTHRRAIQNGTRTEDDVRRGVSNTGVAL